MRSVLGLILLLLAMPAGAVEFQLVPVAQRVIGDTYFILYSPERFGTRLWLGGPGPERRYVPGTTIVDLTDSIYEIGVGCAPRMVLTRPGHHVNDPTIVRRPSDGALLMYFTSANSVNAWPNMLSLAVSTDNGQTWVDRGDLGLGWTPSAVLVGDEIWVYNYVQPGTSDGRGAERHRFAAADGRTRLGPPEPVVVDGVPYVASPQVATWRGKFLLGANGGDFAAVATVAAAQVIWLAESVDGLHFTRTQAVVRVEGDLTVGGVHLTPLDEYHVSVLFGKGPHPLMPTGGTALWEWTFRSSDAPSGAVMPSLQPLGSCPPAAPPAPPIQTASGVLERHRAAPDPPPKGNRRGAPPPLDVSPRSQEPG